MKKLYTLKPIKHWIKFLILFFILLSVTPVQASHFVGGDIEYTCTGVRQWKIKLTLYRDCLGCANCYSNPSIGSTLLSPGLVARPNTTLNPPGCVAVPNQVNVVMTLQKVEDIGRDLVDICGNSAKNGCTNLGTVTPGPFTPSIEKWIFEGTLNLNIPSLNNTTCVYWDIFYTSGARNSGMTNMPVEDFSIGATLHIFNRSTSPCLNNSPIISVHQSGYYGIYSFCLPSGLRCEYSTMCRHYLTGM